MLTNSNRKLRILIWMGLGSALLSSFFSAIIITYLVNINRRVKRSDTNYGK